MDLQGFLFLFIFHVFVHTYDYKVVLSGPLGKYNVVFNLRSQIYYLKLPNIISHGFYQQEDLSPVSIAKANNCTPLILLMTDMKVCV